MSAERVHYLQSTPRSQLRHELIMRLEAALSQIKPNIRQSDPALQLLEARMKKPNSWADMIKLWYKLDTKFPEIGTILCDYDLGFQSRQALMIGALQAGLKAIQ
jgi:hypothetical protein